MEGRNNQKSSFFQLCTVQVERLMRRWYLGPAGVAPSTGPVQGLVDLFTDAKLASPLHQTVLGHIFSGITAKVV